MLQEIKNHFGFKKDVDFANFLGVSSQTLTNWSARNNFDTELIYTKCVEINPEWLLTGKGSMLKQKEHYDKELHVYENKIDEKKEIEIKHLSTQITLYEQSNSLYKELNHEIKTRLEKVEKELEDTKKELEICQGNRTIATRKSELA